ncbi:MAG: apolipoprotein N-acyltransferase [Myxococcota bacterium]
MADAAGLTRRARLAGGAVAALLLFASFPQPVFGTVVDAGPWLAWLAPVAVVLVLRGLPLKAATLAGGAVFWVGYTAILHWIYVVTVHYGHAHPLIGVVAPIGLALYIAAFGAAFGAGFAWLSARGLASAWTLALLWTLLEHGRSFVLTGFPWASLGYAQHGNAWLLGLASFTGVYGLSFVTALGGLAAAEWAQARRAGRATGRGTWAALACVVAAHGLAAFAPGPTPSDEVVRVGVVQGNVDQGDKWDAAFRERTLADYESLTRQAAAAGAAIIAWPETAVPGGVESDPRLEQRLARLARETRAVLVVGAVGLAFSETGRPSRFYDSAFVFDPTGQRIDRYDKTHLVPFGEYVPFQALIGRFLSAVARGIATTGVTPGERPRAIEVELADGRPVRIGVPICYELLFPSLVREFVRDGSQLLLGITNDAWYGRTGAPYQFLAITALRSVETGVWLGRAANTGVSAFVDARGGVHQPTPIFESAWRVHDVPLHASPAAATFYTTFGPVFVGTAWLAALGVVAFGLRRGKTEVRSSAE